jgi:mannosyl-3-phosphoglycerate phosphatase family protein
MGVPVVPVSSKTRAEIERLRDELSLDGPYVVENGAAACVPVGYFDTAPDGVVEKAGLWVREWCEPRTRWLGLLNELREEFPGEFENFAHAGIAGIVSMTGLSETQALDANTREYSEPVRWQGTPQRKRAFLERLSKGGADVLAGGRFIAVAGHCDKGRALAWLRQCFSQAHPGCRIHDLAAGDSENDVAMLEEAETALLVRSPVHEFPALQRTRGVMYSKDYGPGGWAEGVARWLEQLTPVRD